MSVRRIHPVAPKASAPPGTPASGEPASPKTVPVTRPASAANEATRPTTRLGETMQAIRRAYLREDRRPWVVAYTGGEYSTLLLQLVWEVVEALPEVERRRPIVLAGNDRLVESPLAGARLRHGPSAIHQEARRRGLPLTLRYPRPYIDRTFWVEVIGRGLMPRTGAFRWRSDRMRVRPTNRLLERLAPPDETEEEVVLLVGTLKAEPETRGRPTTKRGVGAANRNRRGPDGRPRFAPLVGLDDDEVWTILGQGDPPWGGTHRDLIALYGDAGARERLFAFRNWLLALRDDDAHRDREHRDGNVRQRRDGSFVMGPFTLSVRKTIFERLLELRDALGVDLIHPGEIAFIEDTWRRDQVHEECRQALRDALGIPARA